MTTYQRELLKRPHTVGEELWEIHLARTLGVNDVKNFDYCDGDDSRSFTKSNNANCSDETRKRSRSIGEELWEIHLKRSENWMSGEEEQQIDGSSRYSNREKVGNVELRSLDTNDQQKSAEILPGMSLRSRVLPPPALSSGPVMKQ
jgi:hypothetical protein